MKGKLHVKTWIASGATFWGIYVFLATLMAMNGVEWMWFSNKFFELLASIYPGLTLSMSGAVLGLVYGAICGGVCLGLFSGLHNWFLKKFQ